MLDLINFFTLFSILILLLLALFSKVSKKNYIYSDSLFSLSFSATIFFRFSSLILKLYIYIYI